MTKGLIFSSSFDFFQRLMADIFKSRTEICIYLFIYFFLSFRISIFTSGQQQRNK